MADKKGKTAPTAKAGVVVKRPANVPTKPGAPPGAKPPLLNEDEIRRLNNIMFTFNPNNLRTEVRIDPSCDYPPWRYLPTHIPSKHTVDYMFHPDVYKTNRCKRAEDGKTCNFEHCAFIHSGERYVPRWRNTGAYFDGIWYPPLPITYKWFVYLMTEFKTSGPCMRDYCEDWSVCGEYHEDPQNPGHYVDRRYPAEYDHRTGDFAAPTSKTIQAIVQYHPQYFKKYPCEKIKAEEICPRGRYCSFDHLHGEGKKIQEYKQKLLKALRDEFEAEPSGSTQPGASKGYVPVGMQLPSKNKKKSKPAATGSDKQPSTAPSPPATPYTPPETPSAPMNGTGSSRAPAPPKPTATPAVTPVALQPQDAATTLPQLPQALAPSEIVAGEDGGEQDGPGEWIKAQQAMEQQLEQQRQQQLAMVHMQHMHMLRMLAAQGMPITPQALALLAGGVGGMAPDQQALVAQIQQLQMQQLQQQQLRAMAGIWNGAGDQLQGSQTPSMELGASKDGVAGLAQGMQSMQLGPGMMYGGAMGMVPPGYNMNPQQMMAMLAQAQGLPVPTTHTPPVPTAPINPFGFGYGVPTTSMPPGIGLGGQHGMQAGFGMQTPGASQDSIWGQQMQGPGTSTPPMATAGVPAGSFKNWTVEQVYEWVSRHIVAEVRQMADKLKENHITGDMLDETRPDFREMLKGIGISSWGHQKKLADAVKELRSTNP